jgi:hypothetical protein
MGKRIDKISAGSTQEIIIRSPKVPIPKIKKNKEIALNLDILLNT